MFKCYVNTIINLVGLEHIYFAYFNYDKTA